MYLGWIISLIILIVLSAVAASWAEKKGHKGIGYFCLSLVVSPIIGLIVVASIKDLTKKECPFCKNRINMTAIVCSYCGKELVKRNKNQNQEEKEKWISNRIISLLEEGKTATDAKIQAEAEYSANMENKNDIVEVKNKTGTANQQTDYLTRLSTTDIYGNIKTKVCKNCGTENPVTAVACKDCGTYF